MNLFNSTKKLFRALPFPWNQSDSGKLNMAICLFLYVREDSHSNEDLLEAFRRCVISSCLGGSERIQKRAMRYCMESEWSSADSLRRLSPTDFANTVDDDFRKIFLAPLYLRYILYNDMSGSLGMKLIEGALGAQPDVDLRSYKSVETEVREFVSLYGLSFHEYAAKLFEKGKEVERDTESQEFKNSAWGHQAHFGRVPDNVVGLAVGFYLAVFGRLHREPEQ